MWSYSGNPKQSSKDAVRFLVGDTDSSDKLLLDGEINYLLDMYNGAPLNAAIRAVETIIARFSRLADESAGGVNIAFSQKAKNMRDLLADLRYRLATDDMSPVAGGISELDKLQVNDSADRVEPDFTKHQHENHQAATWVDPKNE